MNGTSYIQALIFCSKSILCILIYFLPKISEWYFVYFEFTLRIYLCCASIDVFLVFIAKKNISIPMSIKYSCYFFRAMHGYLMTFISLSFVYTFLIMNQVPTCRVPIVSSTMTCVCMSNNS